MVEYKRIFPEPIVEVINRVFNILENNSEAGNFFTSPDIAKGYEDIARVSLYNLIGDYLLPKFIAGEELIFESVEAFDELIKHCIVEVTLQSLMDIGLVNSFEDEDGEDKFFLTKEGIDYTEKIFGPLKK